MRNTDAGASDRRRVGLLAAALAVASGLLVFGLLTVPTSGSGQQAHAGGTEDLVVSWVGDGGQVSIVGTGFRPNSAASVRVGSGSTIAIQADGTGTVRVISSLDPTSAGTSGMSVIVSGRAPSGSTRTLVAAAPPAATGHGPVDVMPWSVGVALLGVVMAAKPQSGSREVRRPVRVKGRHRRRR